MWARAVEKAGTFDTDKVIAAMEAFDQEPFLIGTRTFSDTLHHQDQAPYLIIETTNNQPAVADGPFMISEAVPMDVNLVRDIHILQDTLNINIKVMEQSREIWARSRLIMKNKRKLALVTGGSQGIGREISLSLAESEFNIV